jgi:hypothetical protein
MSDPDARAVLPTIPEELRAEGGREREPVRELCLLLTPPELNLLQTLRLFGRELMSELLEQRSQGELPERLDGAIDLFALACGGPNAHSDPVREALEVEIRASVGVMGEGEIAGRAMAFVCNIPPEDFQRIIEGAKLTPRVVPTHVRCPTCSRRRVQTGQCRDCKGAGLVPLLLPPEHRIKEKAEADAMFPEGPGALGGAVGLVDGSGRPIPRA